MERAAEQALAADRESAYVLPFNGPARRLKRSVRFLSLVSESTSSGGIFTCHQSGEWKKVYSMGLSIAVMNDPESAHIDEQNFSTHLELGHDEWEELFDKVLHAPSEIKPNTGESFLDFESRREALFKADLISKGYGMLGRIWYIFSDTYFAPSEVDKLLEECLQLQRKTENRKAQSALDKLIAASQAALKANSGIFLACN